jgi:hypothetical protein
VSVCPSIHPSVRLRIYQYVQHSISLCVSMYLLQFFNLSIYRFTYQPIYLWIYPSKQTYLFSCRWMWLLTLQYIILSTYRSICRYIETHLPIYRHICDLSTYLYIDSSIDMYRSNVVVKTTGLYSGGTGLKSRTGDGLSWLRCFVVFLSPSCWMSK